MNTESKVFATVIVGAIAGACGSPVQSALVNYTSSEPTTTTEAAQAGASAAVTLEQHAAPVADAPPPSAAPSPSVATAPAAAPPAAAVPSSTSTTSAPAATAPASSNAASSTGATDPASPTAAGSGSSSTANQAGGFDAGSGTLLPDGMTVEYRIPDGTGGNDWNPSDNPIRVRHGMVLRLIDEDTTTRAGGHWLHTNGQPCTHALRAIGEGFDCTVSQTAPVGLIRGVFEHNVSNGIGQLYIEVVADAN